MSALRAKCPACRTLTAVAIGPDYQCHACGREFAAGLVRVPRAWGEEGEALAEAAGMALPWPEAAVVAEETLAAQIEATMRELPARPLVLGGCSCAHIGAVRELARRHGRVSVVWIDAHGDEAPPDGLALRMLVAAGDVAAGDITVIGPQRREPPERAATAQRVYVAVDGGRSLEELEPLLAAIPTPAGAGFSGVTPSAANEAALARLGHALGL